jgi:predicted mannosyl-3-phosphoglycerate phosphatase (HAD superfamily)
VGLGDAPNDAAFLAAVDRAVLVPGPSGVDARLAAAVPGAAVAPAPGGAGWAAALRELGLAGEER